MKKIFILMLLMTSVVLANGNFNWKDISYECYHTSPTEYSAYKDVANYYGISSYKDLRVNPGKYFGKNIKNLEIAQNKLNLTANLKRCKLDKSKVMYDYLEIEEGLALKAEVLKKISKKHCKKLAPNMNSCKSMALVKITEDTGGRWSPITHMIYGIFDYKGESYLLPLKDFSNGPIMENEERALKYVKSLKSASAKNVKLENDHNVLSLDVDYEFNGSQLLLSVSSKNLLGNAKGGISISIPEFSGSKRIIRKKSQGFKNVTAYKKGKKLWNREIKKTVRNKYLLLEGWSNKWKTNEEKAIKLVIDTSGLDLLNIHIRSNIIKDKKEYTNPKKSKFYNQQGYYDKVETFILK